jgi:excisionase family DNA binding protein
MARLLRVEQQLTVDQIAERLALSRSTVYYWVRDLPLRAAQGGGRADGGDAGAGRGGEGECEELRPGQASAYEQGLRSFDDLASEPTFRDFLCIYTLVGNKRDRACVSLTDGDPAVMRLVSRWILRLTERAPVLSVRCLPDQSVSESRRFWAGVVGTRPEAIDARRRPSSSAIGRQSAATVHGLLTVTVEDKQLRARLQAWMCRMREGWR